MGWSTTKSELLGRVILELTKDTSCMSGVVLVHRPDTSQTHIISTHLPRRGTCGSPSVPFKRMVQVVEHVGWPAQGMFCLWAEFTETT